MTRMISVLAVACLTAGASAQQAENDACPISGKAVPANATTASHDGHTIGFCCGGCVGTFNAWDDQRKDGFVLTFASQPAAASEQPAAEFGGDPYVLATCPISGKKLGDGAIVKKIEGREVRFCCGGCVEPFNAKRDEQIAALDKKMIEDQMAYYPLTTCVISGEPLFEDGEDIATSFIVGNRLVRTCCSMCKRKVLEDPAPVVAKLDKAVVKTQRASYPITTCPISDGELGHMGEPSEIVMANRLVRFCCAMCEPKLVNQPTAFIATLDAAWLEAGMPKPVEPKRTSTTSAGGE